MSLVNSDGPEVMAIRGSNSKSVDNFSSSTGGVFAAMRALLAHPSQNFGQSFNMLGAILDRKGQLSGTPSHTCQVEGAKLFEFLAVLPKLREPSQLV